MKTILVVDDEMDLTRTLRAILEGAGYRAEACHDGMEALERLKGGTPDLVLMDVMMPVLSGFEVLRAMRQEPGLGEVPVVLMSCVAPGVKQADYGWQAFLRKPFSLEVLLKTVGEIVGQGEGADRPG